MPTPTGRRTWSAAAARSAGSAFGTVLVMVVDIRRDSPVWERGDVRGARPAAGNAIPGGRPRVGRGGAVVLLLLEPVA
ncbi:hypothetical protein GCM10019017_10140 [Streptomyces showdoensis]